MIHSKPLVSNCSGFRLLILGLSRNRSSEREEVEIRPLASRSQVRRPSSDFRFAPEFPASWLLNQLPDRLPYPLTNRFPHERSDI
jgi:hypothetical protein